MKTWTCTILILGLLQLTGCKVLNDVTGLEEEFGPFISPGNNTVIEPKCSLPMDRDTSGFAAFWHHPVFPLDNTKQIGTQTLLTGENFFLSSASSTITGVSAKKMAFEFNMDLPLISIASTSIIYGAGVYLINPVSNNHISFLIMHKGDETYDLIIVNSNNLISVVNNSLTRPSRIGFLIENGEFRLWLDGVEFDVSAFDNAFTEDEVVIMFMAEASSALPASVNGKSFSLQLFSDIKDMTSPFPAGTEDACGNTL